MGRYLLKFSKQGNLKYISHLDLLRLFQRAFKRANINLKYSQGFNPHARIAFAHPLSLGFESSGEYVEFETELAESGALDVASNESEQSKILAGKLASQMPAGMSILSCTCLSDTSKTAVAAAVEYASYIVEYSGTEITDVNKKIKAFLQQEQIINEKFSKKKKKMVQTDIRPAIFSITPIKTETSFKFSLMLSTGSVSNLNPEIMIMEFCRFCGVEYKRNQWTYMRTEMYYTGGKENDLIPLVNFAG